MNGLPLHPLVVHFPIVFSVLAPIAMGLALLSWTRGWTGRRVWFLAVALQVAVFLGGLAAENSGEQDEEIAEKAVSHDLIHEHEEAAEKFVAAAGVVFLLSLAGAFIPAAGMARIAMGASIVGALVTTGIVFRVGELGGELVYKHGAGQAWVQPTAGGAAAPAGDRDAEADEGH